MTSEERTDFVQKVQIASQRARSIIQESELVNTRKDIYDKKDYLFGEINLLDITHKMLTKKHNPEPMDIFNLLWFVQQVPEVQMELLIMEVNIPNMKIIFKGV